VTAAASPPPPPAEAPEEVSDYSGFDFRSEWTGRDRVTELERRIVRVALGPGSPGRVLELGVGFGRLTPELRRVAREYVGVDLNAGGLAELARATPGATGGEPAPRFVEANAYHLPFSDGAFSAIATVRVFHHIARPDAFLDEMARCLRPGGRLLLQYNPRPTIGTLVMDVRQGLRHPAPDRPSITWGDGEFLRVPGERFPIYVPTGRAVRAALGRAGFRIEGEWGTGAERLQRWFPSLWLHAFPPLPPVAPLLPSRFVLCERISRSSDRRTPSAGLLACPRCHGPIPDGPADSGWSQTCSACGFPVRYDGRVLHARYVPAGPSEPTDAAATD
jgi:SAM-dependent methyltransferase